MDEIENLCHFIDLHLGEQKGCIRSWCIAQSDLGGRGLIALRDIGVGEVIFKEKPILLSPTCRKQTLQPCVNCYKPLNEEIAACKNGCSLPVCENCCYTNEHSKECELFRSWQPIEPRQIARHSVNILPLVRALYLEEWQKNFLYKLQGNNIPKCNMEISNAAKCFKKFPEDDATRTFFSYVLAVLNTVAFEAIHQDGKDEASLRGLYPLAGLMNHECTPNTCHPFDTDNTIIVTATKFIPKGSEITTTYAKILWSNSTRRLFLNFTKQFSCYCSRCVDPTEYGTYLNALRCRNGDCSGSVIPVNSLNTESPWKCLKCSKIYNYREMFKIQDFTLAAINSKVNSNSPVRDIIQFVNEKIPKFCPLTNSCVLEAKLTVMWKMNKSQEDFSESDYRDKIRYCNDILDILKKLDAGESLVKKIVEDDLRDTIALLKFKFNIQIDVV